MSLQNQTKAKLNQSNINFLILILHQVDSRHYKQDSFIKIIWSSSMLADIFVADTKNFR